MANRLLTIASAILIAIPAMALAQRSRSAADLRYKEGGHADARACLEKRATESARRVLAAESTFRAVLKRTDESPEDISRALAAFDDASRQYLMYREKQCEVSATTAFGGNGAGDRRLLCQIELDERRAVDLGSVLKDGV